MLRIVDELLWVLRREGISVAPSQAIDAARALAEVGFDDPAALRETLACVLVSSRNDRARFDRGFDEFFATDEPHARDFWGRLRQQGFTDTELDALRELLEVSSSQAGDTVLRALAGGHGQLDPILAAAEIRRVLEPLTNPLQAGFYANRVFDRLGLSQAPAVIERICNRLRDALGHERAAALAEALRREIERARSDVRAHIARPFSGRQDLECKDEPFRNVSEIPFVSLTDAEIEEVRRAVRRLAAKLRGAARVRRRRARRGRLDPHRTMRRSLRTAGIPFSPGRRDRRRDKPRLVVLCDISDSVRTAARFMLELVYALQELFEDTRSFVFISDVGEVTKLFQREPVHRALAQAYGGAVIDTGEASSYGRALRDFESRWPDAVDGRTTVLILGDGRTNYRPHGAEVVERIRARARRILWLCPEPRASWGLGDSVMPVYASRIQQVFEVVCAADLERAARKLVSRA